MYSDTSDPLLMMFVMFKRAEGDEWLRNFLWLEYYYFAIDSGELCG